MMDAPTPDHSPNAAIRPNLYSKIILKSLINLDNL